MRRYLFLILALLTGSLCAFPIGETPKEIIGSLDSSLGGLKKSVLDSLKSSLSNQYVNDYRTYGNKIAYDSLCRRVRVLKAANEHNESDTLASTKSVEQPMSEVDRLKMENQTLRNELSILKNGPEKEPELSQEEKRTRWIVKQLVKQNNAAADTLWKVYRDTSFGHAPLFFDSLSTRALQPFMPQMQKPRYLLAKKPAERTKTRFETLYERNKVKQMVDDKVTFSLVGRNPGAFDYCSLQTFDDELSLSYQQPAREKKLDETATDYSSINLKKPKITKQQGDVWTSSGKLAFQFSQFYVTSNWYKGGDPNTTLLGTVNYDLNYKEGKKIWDNSAEMKLGFYTSSVLEDHAFRVYNDIFKLSSCMGYKLFKSKWYPAAYGELNTQFFKAYKNYKVADTKKTKVAASFLSPTRIFLGVGSKYDYNSNVYAYLSPATTKFLFVVNDDIVDVRDVGIEDTTKKAQFNFGIFAKGKVKWKFTKDINISSTFDIFAPYDFDNVEFNWETVGNFVINRFLSTRLSLNMRFDNTPASDENEKSKLQIQEQLSFGFNYTF